MECVVFIVAGEEEGGSEGPGSADLSVVLFDIADVDDEFLDGDVVSELDSVVLRSIKAYLGILSQNVDQVVGIG